MMKDDVITLISEAPEGHGIFEEFKTTEREVFCRVRSVGFNEFYAAKAAGLEPSIVFILPHDFEYQGEKLCRYHT